MRTRLFSALPLSIFLLAISPLANASNVFAGQWPLLPEGASPAEGEVWGELPNGLRYAIVPTDSASEAVSLRLIVAAGRAQEEKGKAGVSELLVDLANYGTASVSRDQLVQFKLANGMDPQSRAHSEIDLNHTVYRLDLEEPHPAAVEISLGFLREVAAAPLFDLETFEAAKGRLKHSSGLGLARYETKEAVVERVLLRSSSYPKMSDADISAAIEGIELADVKRYWSTWYKADRMLLVVTGVVDAAAVESTIKSEFAAMEASANATPLPSKSDKFRSGGDLEVADASSNAAALWITKVTKVGSLFDAAAEREFYSLDFIGRIAQSYATESDRLPSSALEVYGDYAAISVSRHGSVVGLLEQLLSADKAMHQLAQYGVNAEAFELAKSEYLNLRYGYDMELSSREWAPLVADRLVRCAMSQIPFRFGAKHSEFLQRVVSGIAFEEVRDRCMELFGEKELSYYIELPKEFPLSSKAISKRLKSMRKGYDFTWERAGEADQDWNFGAGFESGGMVESTEIIRFEEYPVLKYEFANKLRMNLVRSDAFQGRVQMMVSFGNGTSDLENANPAFEAMIRSLMLKTKIGNGVEAPTMSEVLKAKGIENLEAGVSEDHLYWGGVGRDESDVEDFLSVVLVWMVAGNLNEETYDDELEGLGKLVERSLDNNSSVKLDTMLFESDARLRSFFDSEDVEALEFKSMQKWLASVRENAYVEITVVGDVVPRTVLRDVRKSFGSAPSRSGKVLQPRHGKKVKWNEPGIAHDTFKMFGDRGNITLLFPQVADKSCASDRLGSVFQPLFEEHLKRSLADRPEVASNLSVELMGKQMIPMSNAIRVRVFCTSEDAAEVEAKLLAAASSFEESLTEELLVSAERGALLGLKRIARSQSSLISLFKQSQGKPKTLGCVLDLLENGFGLSFEEVKDLAKRQFSEDNVRGVSLMPSK